MTALLGRRAVAVVAGALAAAGSATAMVLGLTAPAYAEADTVAGSGADTGRPPASAVTGTAGLRVPGYRLGLAAPRLVVCAADSARRIARLTAGPRAANESLLRECSYDSVQAAVDAVWRRGTTIYVLPGVYRDETVTITGSQRPDCLRCDLQLEGTGERPEDVVIEGGHDHAVGIRAERANGLYLRNLTAQRYRGSAVEVVWTDGFVLDRVTGRWNGSHGLAAMAVDHGVVADCTATGNSSAGILTAPVSTVAGARSAVEVRRCRSSGNLIGYAGGDSVYVHDNDFFGNSVGISAASQGLPAGASGQSHGSFIANRVYGNNVNPYPNVWSGRCAKPPRERERDLVCPATAVPVGSGLVLVGGAQNTYAGNLIYDNWRAGATQYGFARGNRWLGNLVGFDPAGNVAPNGLDFWWDQTGDGNCWQDNASSWAEPGSGVRSTPSQLPDCAQPSAGGVVSDTWRITSACDRFAPGSPADPNGARPENCHWLGTPARPTPG
jgi:hypothetical protein